MAIVSYSLAEIAVDPPRWQCGRNGRRHSRKTAVPGAPEPPDYSGLVPLIRQRRARGFSEQAIAATLRVPYAFIRQVTGGMT